MNTAVQGLVSLPRVKPQGLGEESPSSGLRKLTELVHRRNSPCLWGRQKANACKDVSVRLMGSRSSLFSAV